jgi:2-dehydropantoate 2-reductase
MACYTKFSLYATNYDVPYSLQSLERGRKTEIDYLNGYICARGRQHGIPTPINDAVVKMVKEIESGQRKMTPENLKNPVFANL